MYIATFSPLNTLTYGTYVDQTEDLVLNDMILLGDGGWRSPAPPTATSRRTNAAGDEDCTNNSLPGAGQPTRLAPKARLASSPTTPRASSASSIRLLPDRGSFDLLNRFGGDGNDGFHGMLELSGFLYVGGRTSSTNVDLEAPDDAGLHSRPPFNANSGGTDGLLGRVPLVGGAWRATYYGGTGDEVINCLAPFLEGVFIFGTTASDDDSLPVTNIGSRHLRRPHPQRWRPPVALGHLLRHLQQPLDDFLFGTYIGGASNDYLGDTGDPRGANHLFSNSANLWLGTTVHSGNATPITPTSIGGGGSLRPRQDSGR